MKMSRKYEAEDLYVDVIVDPRFQGDIADLTLRHPVWLVDTPWNRDLSATDTKVAQGEALFDVNLCPVESADARVDNLLMIMGVLDDHYTAYGLLVHGIGPDPSLAETLRGEGFQISGTTPDGFSAARIPGARDRLLGRGPRE
jgi:hypothetical protein